MKFITLSIQTLLLILVTLTNTLAQASSELSGDEIAKQIYDRAEPTYSRKEIKMTLIDHRGKSRNRQALSLRAEEQDKRRMLFAFSSPRSVKNTRFLTFDYNNAKKSDDQWLYLPALRKTRRISAAQRGDHFLGTDFSYEDIKNEAKFNPVDYSAVKTQESLVNGVLHLHIELMPRSGKIAKELGYSKIQAVIDTTSWIATKSDYWDLGGNPLKTVFINKVSKVSGYWTAQHYEVINHKTKHKTIFDIVDVDNTTPIALEVLKSNGLRRPL